jgi:hypothetical protein
MNFENRIELVIREKNPRQNQNLERDIEIIKSYFGLSNNPMPTYESIGLKYALERERVRQIIENKFFQKTSLLDLPELNELVEFIESKTFHTAKEIEDFLCKRKYQKETHSFILLYKNLIQKKFKFNDQSIYSIDLKNIPLQDFSNKNFIIIKSEVMDKMSSIYKVVATAPGIIGIANLNNVFEKNEFPKRYIDLFKYIISESNDIWYILNAKSLWYTFENRDNNIEHSLGKIKNITDTIELDSLASLVYKTLRFFRTSDYSKAPYDIVYNYLKNSKYLSSINNNFVKLNVQESELTDIEADVIKIFKDSPKEKLDYTYLRNLLLDGHSEDSIKKISYSPIIFRNKSKGRRNYTYRLASDFSYANLLEDKKERYEIYKDLLRNYEGNTDKENNSKRRTEQRKLRNWLFGNCEKKKCAICQNEYNNQSLITAHKKKRAYCTEEERTDPNIVMPLCLFGCDTLYENGAIWIDKGTVKVNYEIFDETSEIRYLKKIEGKKLDQEWLNGKEEYFGKKS